MRICATQTYLCHTGVFVHVFLFVHVSCSLSRILENHRSGTVCLVHLKIDHHEDEAEMSPAQELAGGAKPQLEHGIH